jgi:hypothetical protein
MNEFNSRIAAQRAILKLVNKRKWEKEELLALSSKAIDRWVASNRIESGSELVGLLRAASLKLFFLANKSQEQVSEEYRTASAEIADICGAIKIELDGAR